MKKYFRRTWLDIDTEALRDNYGAIASRLREGTEIMAVVKADAYGHGVEHIVKELAKCGCSWFAVSNLEEAGVTFELRHCCNSAATVIYPEMQLDMVRPGIILYGLAPSEFIGRSIKLKPVMQMKTVVSMVKDIPEGTPVSYGRTFISDRAMKIATVPVGYADGLPRNLSGKMKMTVGGVQVPVVGRICMDQCMLDVTGIENVSEGMTVTVFGSKNTVDDIAENANVINYEIICGINKRVPRVYLEDGGVVAISDYLETK